MTGSRWATRVSGRNWGERISITGRDGVEVAGNWIILGVVEGLIPRKA